MNFSIFTKLGRAVAMALAVAALALTGCGDDNGENSGGGGSYDYVELGGLKWMKKNLNVSTSDSWCYDNNSSNCNTYGRLYTWSAAKSACQSVGWRLPTRAEWEALVTAAGGSSVAGKALKSTSGWHNNNNGTDTYGFSALPGGYRDPDGAFSNVGKSGHWWTATEDGGGNAYSRYMNYGYYGVGEGNGDKSRGFSVRCISD